MSLTRNSNKIGNFSGKNPSDWSCMRSVGDLYEMLSWFLEFIFAEWGKLAETL